MNDQPEAMVDSTESELKKRMLEDKEHANKKNKPWTWKSDAKTKIDGKGWRSED